MALFNHLWYDFISDQGTKYRVKINGTFAPNTSDGLGRETLGAPSGFRLEYDSKSQETFKPVIGSKVTFSVIYGTEKLNAGVPLLDREQDVVQTILNDFRSATNDGQYTVEIRRDPDDTDTLFWAGVLLTEQVDVENEPFPREVKFTATDDIANLEYVDYEEFFAAESFKNAIIKILRQTRMADLYWGSDDLFISFQRFITTTSQLNDTGVTGCPYDWHRFISSDTLIPDSDGGNRSRKAGEVLRYLADTFMASVYQSDGRWWVIPAAQTSVSPLAYSLHNYNRGGDLLNAGGNPIQFFNFVFLSPPTGAVKIMPGSSDSWLHPALSVRREYKFSGTLPVVNTGSQLRPWSELQSDDPFGEPVFVYLQNTIFTVQPSFGIQLTGNGALTGDERVGRIRIRLRIKVGDYYLTKSNVNNGTVPYTFPGGVVTVLVFNPTFPNITTQNGFSWETDTSTLWELWTPVLNYKDGIGAGMTLAYNLPQLPADSEGISLEFVDLEAYDRVGNTSSAFSAARLAEATVTGRVLSYVYQTVSTQDTIVYEATNENSARDTIELEPALFGDQLSLNYTRGSIRHADNSTYTTSEWRRSGNTDEFFINELLVHLHAQFRQRSRSTRRLRLFSPTVIHYYNRLFYEAISWVPTRFVFNAGRDEYDIEGIETALQGTPTIVNWNPGGGGGITPPTVPNQLPDVIAGLATTGNDLAETAQSASNKVYALQPPNVGGIVLKNAEGDTDAVTYIAPPLKTATVVLPVAFRWFIFGSARLTTTDEQFIQLNAQAPVAAALFHTEWLAAFAGRVEGVVVRSSAAATIVAGAYKNGVSLVGDNDALSAGVAQYFDLSGEGGTFDVGDALAISVSTDTQPTDVNVTVVLVAE